MKSNKIGVGIIGTGRISDLHIIEYINNPKSSIIAICDKEINLAKDRAKKCGISDFNRVYTTTDMASGDVMFAATGVTDGTLLKGVRIYDNVATTSSIVMRSKTKTIRFIEAEHNLTKKKIIK